MQKKFHLNFYLNQAVDQNTMPSIPISLKMVHHFYENHYYEDQSIKNDRNQDDFLDMPLHNDFIFHNQWNYRSSKFTWN